MAILYLCVANLLQIKFPLISPIPNNTESVLHEIGENEFAAYLQRICNKWILII